MPCIAYCCFQQSINLTKYFAQVPTIQIIQIFHSHKILRFAYLTQWLYIFGSIQIVHPLITRIYIWQNISHKCQIINLYKYFIRTKYKFSVEICVFDTRATSPLYTNSSPFKKNNYSFRWVFPRVTPYILRSIPSV